MNPFTKSIELKSSEPVGAVLILHGLSGSPANVRDLAKALHKKNFNVYVPQLSGHSGNFEEFRKIPHTVWLEDARKAFLKLKKENEELPISVVGQSFGALLSLYLASNYPALICKCAAVSCPMKFRSFIRKTLLPLLALLPEALLNFLGIVHKELPDIGDEESYPKHSIAAGARLVKIRSIVKNRLNEIECKVLIGQDPEDHQVDLRSLEFLKKSLTHAEVTSLQFPGIGHRLLHGEQCKDSIEKVVKFISEN